MAEETKYKIHSFLNENKGKRYTVTDLSKQINISYPTTLKWVEVMISEGVISVEDYGNVKLVFIKELPIKENVNDGREDY